MSQKDTKRIKVLELVVNGIMTNQEAAETLRLCRRQSIRLRKKYTTQGEMGLIHGNRNRHPQYRIGEWIRHDVLRFYREKYHDFNFSHFTDSLKEVGRPKPAATNKASKDKGARLVNAHKPDPNHPWKRSFRENGHSAPAQSDSRVTFSLAIDTFSGDGLQAVPNGVRLKSERFFLRHLQRAPRWGSSFETYPCSIGIRFRGPFSALIRGGVRSPSVSWTTYFLLEARGASSEDPRLNSKGRLRGVNRSRLSWVWCLLASSLILLGGCGGGGGGEGGSDSGDLPLPGSGEEIPIETLEGRWIAIDGNGTATLPEGKGDLELDSATGEFEDVTRAGDTATMFASASFIVKMRHAGTYIGTEKIRLDRERIELRRVGRNKWQSPPDPEEKITLILQSETEVHLTLEVRDAGEIYKLNCRFRKS